jgi:hypothetical protein
MLRLAASRLSSLTIRAATLRKLNGAWDCAFDDATTSERSRTPKYYSSPSLEFGFTSLLSHFTPVSSDQEDVE